MSAFCLPQRKRGRRSKAQEAEYIANLEEFYQAILEINSRLDFQVSARGWCYLMEQKGLINKDEFDRVETLITDARKSGALPLDICAVDETRSFEGLEHLNDADPQSYIQGLKWSVEYHVDSYTPLSFWDDQPYYIEMLVEKIDLKSLFGPICRQVKIPIANAKGWPDVHVRAAMMKRFQKHEKAGRQCVLLYAGDFDPAGLAIAENYRAMFADIPAVGWSPDRLIIDRFGINIDFITAHDLTWIDNLITSSGKDLADPSHSDHAKPYVQDYLRAYCEREAPSREHPEGRWKGRKCEANALVQVPQAARALCQTTIEQYLGNLEEARRKYQSRLELPRQQARKAFVDLIMNWSGANDE